MPRRGGHLSEEAKKKISEARKGKKLSEEHRAKFVEGTRRYVEGFIKIHGHHPNSNIWLGRHHTESTKEKLSKAFRGKPTKPHTAETRKKMSDSHLGMAPWNKGLTKYTSTSVALIGQKKKAWWTPERKRQFAKWSHEFLIEWWQGHPEAKEKLMRVARPTRIELLARASLDRRGIPFQTCKRIEGICFPDLVLHAQRIGVFCNGCFWHACPEHFPIVPGWLRKKIKDRQIFEELRRRGWRVLVAWEHEFDENNDIVGLKLDELLAQGRGAQ